MERNVEYALIKGFNEVQFSVEVLKLDIFICLFTDINVFSVMPEIKTPINSWMYFNNIEWKLTLNI